MGSLFSKPKVAPVQKADPPPAVDDAREAIDQRAARRKRAGRAATLKVSSEAPVSTTRQTMGY